MPGSVRGQLNIILAKAEDLLNVRRGAEKLEAARKFDRMLKEGETLSAAQINYIDRIYEAMWKGAGYESFSPQFKPRKGLRHPK